MTLDATKFETFTSLDFDNFKKHHNDCISIDIRNQSGVKARQVFEIAIVIPLHQLRDSKDKIPTNKPILVQCAGGYRSAAASSIISNLIESIAVYDLSDDMKKFI